MWIAKPIRALNEIERETWHQLERNLPLSQTLAWAEAIERVSGQAYLVFSPDEKVGGVVFSASVESGRFECVNGPWIDWDNPSTVPRQFATFAAAVSKLEKCFRSLSIRPRWCNPSLTDRRLSYLPVPFFQLCHASTMVVDIQSGFENQFLCLSPRMRRTLNRTWKSAVTLSWTDLNRDEIGTFVPEMQRFSEEKGFSVPPEEWFEGFISGSNTKGQMKFRLGSVVLRDEVGGDSVARILVCIRGKQAHYLFGYQRRSGALSSSISLSAALQWDALLQCAQQGVREYDLNGFITENDPKHPYSGVAEFKRQFQGRVIQYDVPEFVID